MPEVELGSEAVKLALSRLGDPYNQPKAGQDNFTDCSYLVQWIYRQLGINLPRTAAEQARFFVENGLTVSAAVKLCSVDAGLFSYRSRGFETRSRISTDTLTIVLRTLISCDIGTYAS